MSKNPFLILGISETATQAEAEAAYRKLRDKHRLDMHQEGERGREAANKLSEVEDAYREITAIFESKINFDGNIFSTIEQLIKANKYDEAQHTLDNISERGAEWHYFQSAIFYKKGWIMESRSQLKLAVSMDPKNEKYLRSLEKLEAKLSNRGSSGNLGGARADAGAGYHRSYQNTAPGSEAADSCCACCQGLMCANCLCDCLQCCR